jgi:predicted phage baseplate assembly protein
VLVGSWVALHDGGHLLAYRVSELRDRTLAEFGLIGRATGIVFRGDRAGTDVYDDLISIGRRTATIHAGSQSLDLAGVPLDAPFGKGTEEARQLTLDTMVLGLLPGQPVAVWGERAGLPAVTATEVATLDAVIHHDGYTTLFFAHDLDHTYARATAILTANLVPATHGETVRQVLGSGDAGRANQRFTLNKPPLTYVAAASSSGAASALEVRVGGVRWEEAPALFGLDGHAQRYVVRADDDGRATVEFGDGQEGARLPTGSENVSAVYRSGLGLAGHVPAGSLILLQTRPPGIRSVVNPLPATGAAEPEDLEGARRNAPRTVLTLDRIVSAQDFEDFARGFAGIGKARAIALQGAEVRFVHLTVAGADGGVVDPQSALYLALVDAIRRSADPAQPFMVDRHLPRLFNVSAKVLVDPRYEVDPVLALVGNAVRQAFSFGPRSFGQPVTAAAVVTVIQGVTGVVATDLDQLYRVDEPGGPRSDTPAPVLRARSARIVDDEVRTSELLLVNESGIALSEMSR